MPILHSFLPSSFIQQVYAACWALCQGWGLHGGSSCQLLTRVVLGVSVLPPVSLLHMQSSLNPSPGLLWGEDVGHTAGGTSPLPFRVFWIVCLSPLGILLC